MDGEPFAAEAGGSLAFALALFPLSYLDQIAQ
jgi:hypothetical protein